MFAVSSFLVVEFGPTEDLQSILAASMYACTHQVKFLIAYLDKAET